MFVKNRLFTFGREGGVVLPRACQSAPESLNLLNVFWEFLTCPCFSHRALTTLSTAVLSYTYMLIYLYLYVYRFIVYTYAHDPVISSLSNRLTKVEALILTEEKKRSKKRCKMLSFSKVFREKSKKDIFYHQHFASFSPSEDGPCLPGLEKNDILTFDFYF